MYFSLFLHLLRALAFFTLLPGRQRYRRVALLLLKLIDVLGRCHLLLLDWRALPNLLLHYTSCHGVDHVDHLRVGLNAASRIDVVNGLIEVGSHTVRVHGRNLVARRQRSNRLTVNIICDTCHFGRCQIVVIRVLGLLIVLSLRWVHGLVGHLLVHSPCAIVEVTGVLQHVRLRNGLVLLLHLNDGLERARSLLVAERLTNFCDFTSVVLF